MEQFKVESEEFGNVDNDELESYEEDDTEDMMVMDA
jgi:hypothetical protein